MLTDAEITAGQGRLTGNKLKPVDVSKLVKVFRMTFTDLEQKNNYDFKAKLEGVDDTGNSEKNAAQIAAALSKMEELGFGSPELGGGRSTIKYKQAEEYLDWVLFIFSTIYPIPPEFSKVNLMRLMFTGRKARKSQSVISNRVF